MKPRLQSLQRLTMIAGILRDRDLHALAGSAARLREIDRQLEMLDGVQEASRNAARSIAEPSELLRYQAYAGLTQQRRMALSQVREKHAASATAMMAKACHSFARAKVLETLQETSRQGRLLKGQD